ncbi:MAG TPA: hypothetical protein VHZ49_06040, partial [Methylomirabilota bacterium]|nr:hypothetical protein [Methylomirabilota bacterium]
MPVVGVPVVVDPPGVVAPASVVVLVVVGVVVPVVGVAVPVADAAVVPERFTAPPHVAAVPVFVMMRSVTMRTSPAGTVNAVTAVVPAGTSLVISTMSCTA